MKQNQTKSSTQQQIFETPHQQAMLTRPKPPNPPSPEAIEKAQFKDKTYWNGRKPSLLMVLFL